MRKLTNRALFICFALMTSFCLIAPATALRSYAQEGGGSTLEGLIKDDSGPLLGATVIVKNTTRGTTTDMDGKFRLEGLQPGDVLQVTYVGYDPYEVTYTGQTTLDILMTTTANQLNAVVVTAMGIERQSKTLSYAAETVGGDDVADIKSVNMINALQGKAAGLQITPNSTGAGGSSKILFRGNKSINGSNQPLVVVDGVPLMMNITSDQVDSNWGAQRDGGDAMSTINPDDIASISLLKGASAAALYGAVAANGAIMITTKSAMAGRLAVNVSSNTTIDTPLSLPEFQNTYGANGQYSWGDKLASKAPDYAEKFFRTGWTTNNSISINGGAEDLRAYFSYGNVTSGGITPENDYSQHTLNAKVGFDLFNDHIKVDFNAKYVNQHISNQPAGGFVFNPLVGTYTFPRGGDWNGYKSNFETYNGELNANVQNWVTTTDETNSNPYWLLNRERPVVERNRYEFGGSIKYQIIDGLSLTGRMRYERADEHYVRNHYASSYGNKYTYGKMDDNRYFSEQLYADLLAQYNHTWDDFSLNATLGTSMMQTRSNNVSLLYEQSKFVAPGNGGAYYPNIFNPSNFYMNGTTMGLERKRLNSVFGAVTFGFKEALFLDVTARNDWSSALAYTDGYSFFYPSVGASLLLKRFVDMGRNIDLFKFRGSYSIVGNDVPVYKTNPRYTYGDQGAINPPKSVPFRTMKTETTH